MKQLKLCILAAAFLIAGAILAGCSLLADSSLIFFFGFACMLIGCLLPFTKSIAAYLQGFFSDSNASDRK